MTRRSGWLLVGLGLALVLILGAEGMAQEQQIYARGNVTAVQVERCGHKPGSCEGTLSLNSHGKAITVKVTGASVIKMDDKPMMLPGIKAGDEVTVVYVEQADGNVARVVEYYMKPGEHRPAGSSPRH